jgi:hypothetical protein
MEVHSLQGCAPPGKEHYVYIASLWDAPGQGAQVLRNEPYLWYAAVMKDAAQRRSWTFYEAINNRFSQVVVNKKSLE